MVIFIVLFAVLYAKTCSKVGYLYRERILERREENGNILYSGRLAGEKVCFTVSDESITYNYGEKVYGPYTVRDPESAEPSEWELFGRYLVGILMMILALVIFTLGLR